MKKLFILLICCLIITGCNSSKKAISVNEFITITENNNYLTNKNIDSYKEHNYIKDSAKGINSDIEIEMIVYDTIDNTKKIQDGQIDNFKLFKSISASINTDKGKNYYKYELTNNDFYMVTSRIDNTLIFCKTTLNNKEKVENIFSLLGY